MQLFTCHWQARLLQLGILALSILSPPSLLAHPLAPTLLQVEVLDGGLIDVTWKTSRLVPPGKQVKPELPAHCVDLGVARIVEQPTYVELHWQADCGAQGLQGTTIRVDGLAESRLNTLVRVIDPAQGTRTWLLRESDASVLVDKAPAKFEVAGGYARLGVEHLLFGPDHVLLLIALMLLIGSTRQLLITITAFTLGHSITLSLATLSIVKVPTMPIEVAIAASIMLVAASIPPEKDSAPMAVGRAPWIMAMVFGLLHGFGFAGALAEVGLPAGEIPLALFSFNVGIELGQILIVLLAWWLLRWWSANTRRGRVAVSYAIGGMAGFWTLQRLLLSAGVGVG